MAKRIIRGVYHRVLRLFVKPPFDRNSFLKSISPNIKILEIGPFYSPVHKGPNVKYFDILNQQDLVDRARKLDSGYNLENIPYIHFVSPVGDLTIIDEKFEAVFSSHVIEHQYDLIDHLQRAGDLLSKGGKYYLIVPDKRFCFDHFQQSSTIADVISAHHEKRKKHTLKSTIEHRVLITHNDSIKHWKGKHGKITGGAAQIKNAIKEYEENDFVDVHALYFTPDSFSEIINLLFELGYSPFKVARVYETPKNNIEFCCVLEKVDNGPINSQ